MQKSKQIKAIINGRIVELTEHGYEIAQNYFGAVKVDDSTIGSPKELRPTITPPKLLDKPIELTIKRPEPLKVPEKVPEKASEKIPVKRVTRKKSTK